MNPTAGPARFAAMLLLLLALLRPLFANAASVDPAELQTMATVAQEIGAVRVAIVLAPARPPTSHRGQDADALRDASHGKARLLADLGDHVFRGGAWTSPSGLIGLTLKPAGLGVLQNSQNAVSFRRDTSEAIRRFAHDLDGSLSALKALIQRDGQAQTEIVLAAATAAHALLNDGTTRVAASPQLEAETAALVTDIEAAVLDSPGFLPSMRRSPASPVTVLAQVDLAALISLQDHRAVRSLRPVGYRDPRPTTWSPWAMDDARREGTVEVSVTLRGGLLYTNRVGWNSQAGRNQAEVHRQALQEILGDAGLAWQGDYPAANTVGTAHVRLTPAQLQRLRDANDPRILAVSANRAMGGKGMGAAPRATESH